MTDLDLDERWRSLNRQRAYRRLAPSTLRAAWWAFRSLAKARRDLKRDGLAAPAVVAPPSVGWGGRTGVNGVLRRTSPTCLERCLVQQAWLSAFGIDRAVNVGVLSDDTGAVRAHAWVDGMTNPVEFEGYRTIHRIEPR